MDDKASPGLAETLTGHGAVYPCQNIMPMETILVVDDEPVVLSPCQNILTSLGAYHVVAMSSALEAARFCENHTSPTVDLALIDVMMPGMNGIELANRIRNDRPTTKIVLMSGFGPRDIARVAGGNNPYRIIWNHSKLNRCCGWLRMHWAVLQQQRGLNTRATSCAD
jgi:CheY-like chemotaxis protein